MKLADKFPLSVVIGKISPKKIRYPVGKSTEKCKKMMEILTKKIHFIEKSHLHCSNN